MRAKAAKAHSYQLPSQIHLSNNFSNEPEKETRTLLQGRMHTKKTYKSLYVGETSSQHGRSASVNVVLMTKRDDQSDERQYTDRG